MNLMELLVTEFEEWPDESCDYIIQNSDKTLFLFQYCFYGDRRKDISLDALASDWQTAEVYRDKFKRVKKSLSSDTIPEGATHYCYGEKAYPWIRRTTNELTCFYDEVDGAWKPLYTSDWTQQMLKDSVCLSTVKQDKEGCTGASTGLIKTEKEIRKEIESLVREMSELHSVEIKNIVPSWCYTMGGEAQLIDMHYNITEGV